MSTTETRPLVNPEGRIVYVDSAAAEAAMRAKGYVDPAEIGRDKTAADEPDQEVLQSARRRGKGRG